MIPFKPELVIFDLDGTLVEFPFDYLYDETNRILSDLSWPKADTDTLFRFFSAFDYFGFVDEPQRSFFIERFWESFDHSNYPLPCAFPGSIKCLKILAQNGIVAAIATARNRSEIELRAKLQPTGILELIALVSSKSNSDGNWMDKSGQIRDICQVFGISPEKTMMIGDIPPDITSAQRAGVGFTVAVLSGGIREDVLRASSPNLIVPGVEELAGYFLTIL